MEQIVTTLAIAIRWSRRKLELQTKEVDVNEAGEWLETVVQVQDMALGRASTKENPEQEKPESSYTKKSGFKKRRMAEWNSYKLKSKKERFVCKGENELTSCKI